MEKVNKYKSDIIDSSIEYKHFILEMVNTMKALGTYTGINTKDFDNNFFIGRHATLKEPRGNFCLYCCNKNNNILVMLIRCLMAVLHGRTANATTKLLQKYHK